MGLEVDFPPESVDKDSAWPTHLDFTFVTLTAENPGNLYPDSWPTERVR